jgi:hypothetical protein
MQREIKMKDISKDLSRSVEAFYTKHNGTNDIIASKRPEVGEWSLKEITGHLVNSASNNQQRFLGLQTVTEMQFPLYQKDHLDWIGIEKINELKFADLFLLCKQYNILIAHIICNIDASKLDNHLVMLDGRKIPLKAIVIDYVRHLKDHLNQFEETLKKVSK